jgi:mRNA-degrading endonuclease RelE of RelBE toxin-antitoxin system
MNAIEWTKTAIKQLKQIGPKGQKTVYSGVEALIHFPNGGNVKHLTNHRYDYRLRVGRYRIFFEFQSTVKIIKIEEVKKRDERTY